jgi:hypothetical protein
VSRIWAVRSKDRDRSLISARGRDTLLLYTASVLALKPISVLSIKYLNFILQVHSSRGAVLTIPLYLVLRLKECLRLQLHIHILIQGLMRD